MNRLSPVVLEVRVVGGTEIVLQIDLGWCYKGQCIVDNGYHDHNDHKQEAAELQKVVVALKIGWHHSCACELFASGAE